MVVMVKLEVIAARQSEMIGDGRNEIINREKKKIYGACDTKDKKKINT